MSSDNLRELDRFKFMSRLLVDYVLPLFRLWEPLDDIVGDVNLVSRRIRADYSRDLDSRFSLTQPEEARDRKAMELLTTMTAYLNLTRELQNLCNLTSWRHSCRRGHIRR